MKKRIRLRHGIPVWVNDSAYWFITICCRSRGINTLNNSTSLDRVKGALSYYQKKGHIRVAGLVLMPDHLHLLAQFRREPGVSRLIESFKRYLARHHGIKWQEGFFDHRVRSDKLGHEILQYILMNPVRAGLVSHKEKWPYLWLGD